MLPCRQPADINGDGKITFDEMCTVIANAREWAKDGEAEEPA
jgi:Ca2+-binding EF-hand superfamily protein